MPLIDVTYSPAVPEPALQRLRSVLPDLVSKAVECPEEPYDGNLQPGDIAIWFRRMGPLDSSGLDVVIEVRSKWFESRSANRHQRVDVLRDGIQAATDLRSFGVYLSLPVAAWSQTG